METLSKGSSNFFLTRADYAKISIEKEGTSSSSPFTTAQETPVMAAPSPAPAPASAPAPAPAPVDVPSTAIEMPMPDLDVEVIPPDTIKSLVKLEAKVERLSSDLVELKIVNAGLLGVLAITIYPLTRPIW